METVDIDGLADAINRELEQYSADITAKLKKEVTRVANQAVKRLKLASPVKTGVYSQGWRRKTQKSTGLAVADVVYNSTSGFLTHLLENGHVNRDGTFAQPVVHIKPVEEWVQKELTEGTEKIIRES